MLKIHIHVKEEDIRGNVVWDTVDEKRFIELYGDTDLKFLKRDGKVGDTIGQGRWYYAILCSIGP